MNDPANRPERPRDDVALWILGVALAAVVGGGLLYGLSHPSIYTSNPPQTVGSAAEHARSGHPM
jgi:hypothetical protein